MAMQLSTLRPLITHINKNRLSFVHSVPCWLSVCGSMDGMHTVCALSGTPAPTVSASRRSFVEQHHVSFATTDQGIFCLTESHQAPHHTESCYGMYAANPGNGGCLQRFKPRSDRYHTSMICAYTSTYRQITLPCRAEMHRCQALAPEFMQCSVQCADRVVHFQQNFLNVVCKVS